MGLELGLPRRLSSKESPAKTGQSLGQEDPLEEEMATHSSILAWKILWKQDPSGLQFMGSEELNKTYLLNHHHYSSFMMLC